MSIPGQLSLVIFDNLNDLISVENLSEIFTKILKLKRLGYGKYFDQSFIPYDSLDFISRYYLLCIDQFTPIACIRMLSFNKAQYHHQTIPLIKFAKDSNQTRHIDFIHHYLSLGDCLYSGNFTVHPQYRSREFINLAKDFVSASTYMEMISGKYVATFAAGTPRMKTDLAMLEWGYEEIFDKGGLLPNLVKKESNNEVIKLMIMKSASFHGRQSVSKIESIISEKIEIISRNIKPFNQAA